MSEKNILSNGSIAGLRNATALYDLPLFQAAICDLVSRQLGVPVMDIVSDSRYADILEARQIAQILMMRYLPGCRNVDIAKYFAQNHSTVTNSIRKISDLLQIDDPLITEKYNKCKTELESLLN